MPRWELQVLIDESGETIAYESPNRIVTDKFIYVTARESGRKVWVRWCAVGEG